MILLNLLDLATTLYITSHGGVELNPIMAYCIDIGIFPILKLTVGSWAFWWLHRHSLIWYRRVCAVYALIVLNNLITILILI
jgi:hypothetical protein